MDIQWQMREGINPQALHQAIHTREAEQTAATKARAEQYERGLQENRRAAEAQVGPFCDRLSEILGAEVTPRDVRIHQFGKKFTPTCRFLEIEEAAEDTFPFSGTRVLPSRELTAVWTGDEIHIHACGQRRSRRPYEPAEHAEKWNVGPVHTTEDLIRIIEQRASHRWEPPAPEPAAEPTRPSMADRSQEIVERLAAQPRYQDGIRGLLLALAMSNLALAQPRQAADE